ncbi:MAG TPA: ABC transporter substrate-binding protein [Verrucomicrobiae bacterium]|jgi:NitT/TauT family transport system substrate-binding protein|nr:ABC transporter substrate-binding protein [Verrucomicrobiae bacterium]
MASEGETVVFRDPASRRDFLARLGVVAAATCGAGLSGIAFCAKPPLRKLTYAVSTADLNVGYPFATLAKGLGYYQQEGLDVDIVPGQSSATTAQLLLSGHADIGLAQPDPVMIQRANNKIPLVSFYAVCRRGTNRFVVNPDSPIQSVHDLKGKKVGVNDLGSGGVTYLRARLKEAGMSPNDVQLMTVGYGTPFYEALKNHNVDAEVSFTGGIARQQMAGYAVRLLPETADELTQYSFNLFATQAFIDKNPDVIAKLGRAIAMATVFLMTNPEAAVRVFWKQYPDRAPKNLNDPRALQNDLGIIKAEIREMAADELPLDFQWGSQDAATFAKIENYLSDAGQIPKPIAPSDFFTNAFAGQYNQFDHQAIVSQAKNWK